MPYLKEVIVACTNKKRYNIACTKIKDTVISSSSSSFSEENKRKINAFLDDGNNHIRSGCGWGREEMIFGNTTNSCKEFFFFFWKERKTCLFFHAADAFASSVTIKDNALLTKPSISSHDEWKLPPHVTFTYIIVLNKC